jgi:hypothetical protein
MWSRVLPDRKLRLDELVTTETTAGSVGRATIYLSEDPAVALAEFARHWDGSDAITALWRVTRPTSRSPT